MKEIDEAFLIFHQVELKNLRKVSIKKQSLEDYLIKKTIGKGTFSVVKLGEHLVAIKILNKEKIKTKEDLILIQSETKILDHPNIIKTYQISETPKYFIIMEYCEGGELFDYIVEKDLLDEYESSNFLID